MSPTGTRAGLAGRAPERRPQGPGVLRRRPDERAAAAARPACPAVDPDGRPTGRPVDAVSEQAVGGRDQPVEPVVVQVPDRRPWVDPLVEQRLVAPDVAD